MPTATITIVGKRPTAAQKEMLFRRTTDLMVEILGRTKNLVLVSIEHQNPEDWAAGGVQLASQESTGVQVAFRLLQGANTPEQYSRMNTAMHSMLEEVLGPISIPPYVVFEQIPDYAWGYKGKTIAEHKASRPSQ